MKSKNGNTIPIIISLIGCIGIIVSFLTLDKLERSFVFAEGWPDFSTSQTIRSIIIFISILMMVWGLIGSRRPKLILGKSNGLSLSYLRILVVLFVSFIFSFLFINEPLIFNALSMEDGPLEWGQVIFLFGSCFITAFSLVRSCKGLNISKAAQLSLAFLSLIFFVMVMEEVSWFQRVLEIDTPKKFKGNWQNEMNLHNFATDYAENIYYFGTFLFLVVFPFIRVLFPYVSNNKYLKIFIARPYIVVIGSIASAYNFDMWNGIFTQIAFFGSVVILCVFAIFSSTRNERFIILFTIVLFITTQVLFLTNGEKLNRIWEVTEYKEFLITLVLFIYSLDIFTYINGVNMLEKANKILPKTTETTLSCSVFPPTDM